jgi:16S rRNA G966 N2-methylase RsmD
MITPLIPVLTKHCASGVLLYIEIEKKNILSGLPDNWSIIREKTAGQVRYHLLRIE